LFRYIIYQVEEKKKRKENALFLNKCREATLTNIEDQKFKIESQPVILLKNVNGHLGVFTQAERLPVDKARSGQMLGKTFSPKLIIENTYLNCNLKTESFVDNLLYAIVSSTDRKVEFLLRWTSVVKMNTLCGEEAAHFLAVFGSSAEMIHLLTSKNPRIVTPQMPGVAHADDRRRSFIFRLIDELNYVPKPEDSQIQATSLLLFASSGYPPAASDVGFNA
jgi:hypothetical protein